jgi:hypothetical protein
MAVRITKPGINLRDELTSLKKHSGIAGEEMLRANTALEQASLLGLRPYNIIINGDFQVWQRQTITDSSSSEYRTADRWYNYVNNSFISPGNGSEARSTDVPAGQGFNYSWKLTAGGTYTNGNYAMLRYHIEGKDLAPCNDKGFTLQFWVKASKPGLYTVLVLHHNTTQQRQLSKTYYINGSDEWQFVVVTFQPDGLYPFDDDDTQFLSIDWAYGNNTSYSGGTFNDKEWANNVNSNRLSSQQVDAMSEAGDVWALTGVQMTPGEYPSGLPFGHRTYGEELALCQRYFYKLGGEAARGVGQVYPPSDAELALQLHHPVQMYRDPDVSLTDNPSYFRFRYIGNSNYVLPSGSTLSTTQVTQLGGSLWFVTGTSHNIAVSGELRTNESNVGDTFIWFDAEIN